MTRTTAKLFMHGRSQAVRLPKEFRMPGTEVEVIREGDSLKLSPLARKKGGWDDVFKEIDALGMVDDYAEGWRDQRPLPTKPKA